MAYCICVTDSPLPCPPLYQPCIMSDSVASSDSTSGEAGSAPTRGNHGGLKVVLIFTRRLQTSLTSHLRALAALEDYNTHIIMVNSLYEEPDRCVFADHAISVTTVTGCSNKGHGKQMALAAPKQAVTPVKQVATQRAQRLCGC